MIVFDKEETKNLEITNEMIDDPVIASDLPAAEKTKVELKDGKLMLPPHASVVIRTKTNE